MREIPFSQRKRKNKMAKKTFKAAELAAFFHVKNFIFFPKNVAKMLDRSIK